MNTYSIIREKEINGKTVFKFVHSFESEEDALDELFRQSRKHGYEPELEKVTWTMGFCCWMLFTEVNGWKYRVNADCDEFGF